MTYQPQTKTKHTKHIPFCSVQEQQRQNTKGEPTLKSPQNFDYLGQETKNYLDKWNTYTLNIVGGAIDLLEESEKGNNADVVEKFLKDILNKANHLPDTITKVFQKLYGKFKQMIIEATQMAKSNVISLFQKIAKTFEVTLLKIKTTIVGTVMRLNVAGQEKIANVIITITEKIIAVANNIKTQLGKIERTIMSIVKNVRLSGRLLGTIDRIKNMLSSIQQLSTKGMKIVNGIGKFIGKFALVIDIAIKAFKTIRSGFDSDTDFNDTGIDSFWYYLAGTILTVIIAVIGIILAKVGFVVAGCVLVGGMIGFAIYEMYEGVDLLALAIAEPLKRVWEKSKQIYEEIKQQISEIPKLLDTIADKVVDYSEQVADELKRKMRNEVEELVREIQYKHLILQNIY